MISIKPVEAIRGRIHPNQARKDVRPVRLDKPAGAVLCESGFRRRTARSMRCKP